MKYRRRSPEEWVIKYKEVMELKEKGLGYRRIAKRLGISKNTVSGWIYHGQKPIWVNVNLSPSKEFSYVLGVYLGDGFITRSFSKQIYHGNLCTHYDVGLGATDEEFVAEYARCLSILLGKKIGVLKIPSKRANHRDMYRAVTSCMILYNFLEGIKENPYIVEPFIANHPKNFLRGFFDSEGSIYADKRGNNTHSYQLDASNTNPAILRLVQDVLFRLGIRSRVNGFKLHISARCKDNFAKYVGFTINRKQDKLINWLVAKPRGLDLFGFRASDVLKAEVDELIE